ncbi:helix-turn-helix domain-containing protein [Leucobacter salsicius]|uniref:helix-turn-helix domain-containing protein n=1 Tax=Leucobacter salsicius TaxID=664638 RepID=UPI00034B47E4|nr:helix-turn-helix domain-containing protein [Leucobacter salsicius]
MGIDEQDPTAALAAARDAEKAASAAFAASEAALDAAIRDARDAGLPWEEVAAATGIPMRSAQWRLQRLTDSAHSLEAQTRPSRAGVPQTGATTEPPPGTITVTEAAKMLGYAARQSVLDLVEQGQLEAIEVERPGRQTRRRIVRESVLRHPRYQVASGADPAAVSVSEAARRAGVSRPVITLLLQKGKIRAGLTPTGAFGIDTASLGAYVAERERTAGSSVTVLDAAERLGVSRAKVTRLLRDGELSGEGEPPRVLVDSIERYEQARADAESVGSMTVAEAAEVVGVSRPSIYAAIQRGQLARDEHGRLSAQEVAEYRAKRAR